MNIIEKVVAPYGRVEVFQKDRQTGYETIVYNGDNIILNTGRDLLAQALSGGKAVNGMYFPYTNAAVAEAAVPVNRTVNYYHTTGSTNPKGFTRAPLSGPPAFDTSNPSVFNTNQVIFTAVSNNTTVIVDPGNELTDNVSNFYGAVLCYLDPNPALYANDIAFSAINFPDVGGPTEVLKLPNVQVGVRWIITFP